MCWRNIIPLTKLVMLLNSCRCFIGINLITINTLIQFNDMEILRAFLAINITLLFFTLLVLIKNWRIMTLSRIIRSLSKYIFLFTRSLFVNHIFYSEIFFFAIQTFGTFLITKIKSVNNFAILTFPFIFLKNPLLFNFYLIIIKSFASNN